MERPRPLVSLPVVADPPEVPLYTGHLTGDLENHLREVGRNKLAEVLFPVSRPKKLSCPGWGIPASTCRKGGELARNPRSVCHESNCYAKRGRFLLGTVQAKLEQSYKFLFDPLHVPAAIHMIRWESDELFRMFVSGDIQGAGHLQNLITIAMHVRPVVLWVPTREREVVLKCREEILRLAPNLFIRASGTTIGGRPPTWWEYTSTVTDSDEPGEGICPSWEQGGKCLDCRDCTDPAVKNVTYRRT